MPERGACVHTSDTHRKQHHAEVVEEVGARARVLKRMRRVHPIEAAAVVPIIFMVRSRKWTNYDGLLLRCPLSVVPIAPARVSRPVEL